MTWWRRLCDFAFNLGLVLGRRRRSQTDPAEAAMQELRREIEKRLRS
ncbi:MULTISPECIES: hypothetical protein [unclassified Mesorhizobium]|nr:MULTISPECIES: hypothetical protein [unclassified Mesorhizobium]